MLSKVHFHLDSVWLKWNPRSSTKNQEWSFCLCLFYATCDMRPVVKLGVVSMLVLCLCGEWDRCQRCAHSPSYISIFLLFTSYLPPIYLFSVSLLFSKSEDIFDTHVRCPRRHIEWRHCRAHRSWIWKQQNNAWWANFQRGNPVRQKFSLPLPLSMAGSVEHEPIRTICLPVFPCSDVWWSCALIEQAMNQEGYLTLSCRSISC